MFIVSTALSEFNPVYDEVLGLETAEAVLAYDWCTLQLPIIDEYSIVLKRLHRHVLI